MPWTCSIVDRHKKRLFGPQHRDESAVLIIVLHTSSVHHQCLSPFVHKKKFRQGNHEGHFGEFGGLSRGPGYFVPELEAEIKKLRLVTIMASIVPCVVFFTVRRPEIARHCSRALALLRWTLSVAAIVRAFHVVTTCASPRPASLTRRLLLPGRP